jgi:hypothetical protein
MKSIREDVQRLLDGELNEEQVPEEAREEARSWSELLADVRAAGAEGAPAGLETRVMASIRAGIRLPWWRRVVSWWLHPQPVRFPPLAGVAVAAAAVLVFVLGPFGGDAAQRVAGFGPDDAESTVYVQFLLRAPSASSVAIAGDFTDWAPNLGMDDSDGDGIWTVRVPMKPGVHEYMFLIDGTRWVTDPNAERYEQDGYGHSNAILAVPHVRTAGL